METDDAFERINAHIREGRYSSVRPEVYRIAELSEGDPFTLIKCASLLKVIDEEEGCQDILGRVEAALPEGGEDRFAAAQALRRLGRPGDALRILHGMGGDDPVLREEAAALSSLGRHDEALSRLEAIGEKQAGDRTAEVSALSSLGRHDEALSLAEGIPEASGPSYDSMLALCRVLTVMGRSKDAVRRARAYLREEGGADGNALAAAVMWFNGKTPAAAGFARRALEIDHTHQGAAETMAMCLIEKGRTKEAKVLAGAINQHDPGSDAAIRILDACRQAASLR
ncbi:MAG: hypothetical protein RBQ77_04620 [Candidatus Methanomethylophilaceae archaeon]|jgi:tetratricopeptide (TPR) repeat protein|nr:hypothetical protein [Candidatus Methanomethylophilaceae archaeon]NLF33874.1 tetratricopeptide repeat protein [Thermoplasmatales archaeon]